MDIDEWFDVTPSHVVNEVALCKKYIEWTIRLRDSLSFDKQTYIIKEINNMARKVKENAHERQPVITDKPVNGNGRTEYPKTRWASADIRSAAHREAVKSLAANPSFVLDSIVELVDGGYELHVKRADKGSTVRSMLFCKSADSVNNGGGLSAEAPDAWLSLSALVYKHVYLLAGRWFPEMEATEESDGWR